MKARNLLNGKEYEVKQFKNVLFSKVNDDKVPYLIYTLTTKKEIEEGMLFGYYEIEGKIYESFWTNEIECFVKKTEQMRLEL